MYDLIVIGGGSGGVRAARLASLHGAKVALIEDGMFAGTCVNVGCIPKKLYVNASVVPHQVDIARDYGWDTRPGNFSLAALKQAKDAEVTRLRGVYIAALERAGVALYNGKATIQSPIDNVNRIVCGDVTLQAKRVLIATGCTPYMPKMEGGHLASYSDDLFTLDSLPTSAVIYGGGYIALEFAGLLARLGTKVDLIYRGTQLLRGFDIDLVETLKENLVDQGVCVHVQTSILSLSTSASNRKTIQVHTTSGDIASEFVLFAIGRKANLSCLCASSNTDNQHMQLATTDDGFIQVDENYQTSIREVYALGDVIGGYQLTPLAIAEAMDFVAKYFGVSAPRMPVNISSAVFVHPPLAGVGKQEGELQRNGTAYHCFEGKFTPLHASLGKHAEKVHYKLLVEQATDQLVGAHIIGEHAPEIIQILAAAIESGMTKTQLDVTLAIHPIIAEELVTHYQPSRSWSSEK